MSEYLDVLTEHGLPTGERKLRSEVHQDGDWHRTFHLWIVRENRFVLMQRRALGKDLEAGKLDVTVGGHFAAGETLKDVLREVEEELGLRVNIGDLRYLGSAKVERHYPALTPTVTDKEHQERYLLRCDQPLSHYQLNPAEVEVLYELSLPGALALFRAGTPLAAAGYDAYGRTNNALLFEADLMTQAQQDIAAILEQIAQEVGV